MINKNVDEILKQYPRIGEDIQRAQTELNRYIALQQEARDPLKAQSLSDMPHMPVGNVSDLTYQIVEKLMDNYQTEINEYAAKINALIDLKKWLDKAFATLTDDERQIVYLRYNERWQAWKIMQRLGILDRRTFCKLIDSAKEKVVKILFT